MYFPEPKDVLVLSQRGNFTFKRRLADVQRGTIIENICSGEENPSGECDEPMGTWVALGSGRYANLQGCPGDSMQVITGRKMHKFVRFYHFRVLGTCFCQT